MKVIKYCGICGNEIEIDYEPRQAVKTVCSKCKTETDWKFFNNGNFDTIGIRQFICTGIRILRRNRRKRSESQPN